MALEKYSYPCKCLMVVPSGLQTHIHNCNIFLLIKKFKDLFQNNISGLIIRVKIYDYSCFYSRNLRYETLENNIYEYVKSAPHIYVSILC